ncbi:paramyosin-like isoform X4 [Takifugu flavidus]|uniref:paramyosin-like isoform X4 n=1 Tax=Takifugu flavidus TaxID=433684 RepID=UPI002544A490|nr:paramyosin-like isoform X4 [Takifugu flavidus]
MESTLEELYQNQVLVQTIADLQVEADDNASDGLEKLHSSGSALQMSGIPVLRLLLDELVGSVANIPYSRCGSRSSVGDACALDGLTSRLHTEDTLMHDLERELSFQPKMKEITQKDGTVSERRLQQEEADANAEAAAEMMSLWKNLSVLFDKRMEEKEMMINQQAEELNAIRLKIQRMEMCTLLAELSESKKQHLEHHNELLQRDEDLQKLGQERDELRAMVALHVSRATETLEADLALCQEKLNTAHLEVRSRNQLILELRAEMKRCEQKFQKTQQQMAALEGEVKDLKRKIRGHQVEACELDKKVSKSESLKAQKEKEQQHLHDQLLLRQQQNISCIQVETFEENFRKREAEGEHLHQQLEGKRKKLKDACSQAEEHKETAMIYKQKYMAAIEKVRKMQGQMEHLQEELQYSQQKLKESQSATRSVREELAETAQWYRDKVTQWENSQEALDQLTDELEASQNLLMESQQKVNHLKGETETLQEQVDTLKQQKLTLECDLRLYQQSHSHPDKEYLSLLRHRQQLQKSCAKHLERLAECEKAILQMKSELERQVGEKSSLKESLAASRRAHMSDRSQLESEVQRLTQEVAHLELELANAQKVHFALLKQSEEELKEARQDAVRSSAEAGMQRGEVQRLQEELQKREEESSAAHKEQLSLRSHVNQLMGQLEELRVQHQAAVEELAACAEEARQMEGRVNEGKEAEGKIRSLAVKLQTEVSELRGNLQQAADHRLQAEREKREAQSKVDTLRSKLEEMQDDNQKLLFESKMVMKNVTQWISEQKVSSENISVQLEAQTKVLLTVTQEKEHLLEANNRLKLQVKRLKEVVDEKEKDAECFKAYIRNRDVRQDEATLKAQGCVALNLNKIQDMQLWLRQNLEAIGTLNQQLNALSMENDVLRRQLEEERSMRRPKAPPACQRHQVRTSIPSPPSTPEPGRGIRGCQRVCNPKPAQGGGPKSPGESQAFG